MKEVACERQEWSRWKKRGNEGLDEQGVNMTKCVDVGLWGDLLTGGGECRWGQPQGMVRTDGSSEMDFKGHPRSLTEV